MKTLYKSGSIVNEYKVELDEIETLGSHGVSFTSVFVKKYVRYFGDERWIFMEQYVYTDWSIDSLSKFFINTLGYTEGEEK